MAIKAGFDIDTWGLGFRALLQQPIGLTSEQDNFTMQFLHELRSRPGSKALWAISLRELVPLVLVLT